MLSESQLGKSTLHSQALRHVVQQTQNTPAGPGSGNPAGELTAAGIHAVWHCDVGQVKDRLLYNLEGIWKQQALVYWNPL